MKALVYVEGPSDRDALPKILRPIIETAKQNRIGIRFLPLGSKSSILRDAAQKAAGHLAEHPADFVFVLPDLYPMACYDGTRDQHRSLAELRALLESRFHEQAAKVRVSEEARGHFKVHCLKHDLEALCWRRATC